MYSAVTENVRVTVRPEFSDERSAPEAGAYFWLYGIEISNLSLKPVTLLSRHWRITDALGQVETVDGPGVVGEQPTIAPGAVYRYVSGCPLRTPTGAMVGAYDMIDGDGRRFSVEIPAFSLDSPYLRRVLN